MLSFLSFVSKQPFWSKLLFTAALFLLVALPRFNRNSMIVERPMNDARYFVAYVEYFRGEQPSDFIRPASNWRILVPYLASLLPFTPLSAINITNLFCLSISIIILFTCMALLNIRESLCWMGCWIFIFSFPTFYYTCIGYIDPGVMLFTSLAVFFTLKQNFSGLILAYTLGALTKETIIVVLPFTFLYTWYLNRRTAVFWATTIFILFVIENILIRQFAYVTPGERNPAFWGFSISAVYGNLTRINSFLAPLLSFGIPGCLFYITQRKLSHTEAFKNPLIMATWAMLLGAIALLAITAIATFCDGRIIWQMYYPLIISGMLLLDKQLKST